jgi:hypothetical protein
MRLKHVLTVFAVVAGVFLWGCGQSATGPAPVTEAQVVGTWNPSSMHVHMVMTTNIPGTQNMTIDTTETNSPGDYLQFNSDHTFTSNSSSTGGPPSSGTWSLSGNTLKLISSPDTMIMTATINGKSGTFVSTQTQSSTQGAYTVTETITVTIYATKP